MIQQPVSRSLLKNKGIHQCRGGAVVGVSGSRVDLDLYRKRHVATWAVLQEGLGQGRDTTTRLDRITAASFSICIYAKQKTDWI